MREHVVDQELESQLPVNRGCKANSIRYTVASTPYAINQYYKLLEKVYQKCFLESFKVSPNEHFYNNSHGNIVIAIDESSGVVGGARLITSSQGFPCKLPLESDSIYLNKLFPDFNLSSCAYSEWGRFVIDKGTANKSLVSENIARLCVQVAVNKGSKYLFGLPTLFMKERYEKIFSNMGLSFIELIPYDQMPIHTTFSNVNLYLAVTDLHNIHRSQYELLSELQQGIAV